MVKIKRINVVGNEAKNISRLTWELIHSNVHHHILLDLCGVKITTNIKKNLNNLRSTLKIINLIYVSKQILSNTKMTVNKKKMSAFPLNIEVSNKNCHATQLTFSFFFTQLMEINTF